MSAPRKLEPLKLERQLNVRQWDRIIQMENESPGSGYAYYVNEWKDLEKIGMRERKEGEAEPVPPNFAKFQEELEKQRKYREPAAAPEEKKDSEYAKNLFLQILAEHKIETENYIEGNTFTLTWNENYRDGGESVRRKDVFDQCMEIFRERGLDVPVQNEGRPKSSDSYSFFSEDLLSSSGTIKVDLNQITIKDLSKENLPKAPGGPV